MTLRTLRATTPRDRQSLLATIALVLFVSIAFSCFATVAAQRPRLRGARDVIVRALVTEPARLAPAWMVRLCELITEPRATGEHAPVESADALGPPAQTRPHTAAPRAVDRRDPYAGGVAPTRTTAVATVVTESGASPTMRVSATRPALDPDDPYAVVEERPRLTVSDVEAANPYF